MTTTLYEPLIIKYFVKSLIQTCPVCNSTKLLIRDPKKRETKKKKKGKD